MVFCALCVVCCVCVACVSAEMGRGDDTRKREMLEDQLGGRNVTCDPVSGSGQVLTAMQQGTRGASSSFQGS
jgi:hypothetical protein